MTIADLIFIGLVLWVVWLLFKWYQQKQTRYIPKSVKEAVLKRYFDMCAVCPENNKFIMDFHHRKEYSDGGDNTEKNIVPLCPYHHSLVTRYPPTRGEPKTIVDV